MADFSEIVQSFMPKKDSPLDRAVKKINAAATKGTRAELSPEELDAYNAAQTMGPEQATKAQGAVLPSGQSLPTLVDVELVAQGFNYNLGNAITAIARGELHRAASYLNAEILRLERLEGGQ